MKNGSRPTQTNNKIYECNNCQNNCRTNFQNREEKSPLQTNKRTYECSSGESSEKKNFLGHQYPSHVPSGVWENQFQAHQYKQPFLGPEIMKEQIKREMIANIEKLFHQAKAIRQ